jgi:hypothetical protein
MEKDGKMMASSVTVSKATKAKKAATTKTTTKETTVETTAPAKQEVTTTAHVKKGREFVLPFLAQSMPSLL